MMLVFCPLRLLFSAVCQRAQGSRNDQLRRDIELKRKPRHHHHPAAFSNQVKTATSTRHSENLIHSPLEWSSHPRPKSYLKVQVPSWVLAWCRRFTRCTPTRKKRRLKRAYAVRIWPRHMPKIPVITVRR